MQDQSFWELLGWPSALAVNVLLLKENADERTGARKKELIPCIGVVITTSKICYVTQLAY